MGMLPDHPRLDTTVAADGASRSRRRFLGRLAASIGSPLLAAVMPVRARAPSHHLHLQDFRGEFAAASLKRSLLQRAALIAGNLHDWTALLWRPDTRSRDFH